MGQPRSASPPPALPRPLPPPRPLLPSTIRSVWRLPYSEKGKAEHNLSLCNYLSGTACEASATSPQPCKKINYTHALGDTDGTMLPCTPQRAHLWEERAAQASPGLLIPALRPDTHPPSSSPDTSAFIFFSPSASPGEKGKSHLAAKKSWMRREKENKFLAVSDKRSWRWENGLKVAYNF